MTITNFESGSIEKAAGAVREFRRRLIDHHGFEIANSAGELAHPGWRTWVATTYAGGEYELTVWTRTPEAREGNKVTVRVTAQLLKAHPGYLEGFFELVVVGAQVTYEGPGLRK